MLISSSLCKEIFISGRITLPFDNLFSEIADMKDPLIGRPTLFQSFKILPKSR